MLNALGLLHLMVYRFDFLLLLLYTVMENQFEVVRICFVKYITYRIISGYFWFDLSTEIYTCVYKNESKTEVALFISLVSEIMLTNWNYKMHEWKVEAEKIIRKVYADVNKFYKPKQWISDLSPALFGWLNKTF